MSETSNRLPVLAHQIKVAHRRAKIAAKRSLKEAIKAGELLIEAKESIGHGEWLQWLDAYCDGAPIKDRRAFAALVVFKMRHP